MPESQSGHNLPKHIAVVMDGNGRWAEKRRRPRSMGHQAGVKSVKTIVRYCAEKKISALTLFAFSSENWSRPQPEVKRLMDLFLRALRKEVGSIIKNNVRLEFIGNRLAFSHELQQQMIQVEQESQENRGLRLTIAVNYGGKWDILQAMRQYADDRVAGNIASDAIDSALDPYFCLADLPAPDLFIRTGGEQRISNFLLWQVAYSELYMTDVLWPDFNDNEMALALIEFSKRKRRFGRVDP